MSYLTNFWTSSNSQPAYLKGPERDYAANGFLEVGGWCVPIMWSMCFSGKDVAVSPRSDDEDSDMDGAEYGASCDTTVAEAIRNLEKRVQSLLRIVPEHTHDACSTFIARLKESTKQYVHMDVSLLLQEEEKPEAWASYWSDLLNGLDAPVEHVRRGPLRVLLGLGLPPSWKYLGLWAVSNGSQTNLLSKDLPLYRVVGAADVRELKAWQV